MELLRENLLEDLGWKNPEETNNESWGDDERLKNLRRVRQLKKPTGVFWLKKRETVVLK